MIKKSRDIAQSNGFYSTIFIHSHSRGLIPYPSDEDYQASLGFDAGIMINKSQRFYFFKGKTDEIKIENDILKGIINNP